jgi:hypothetical protein
MSLQELPHYAAPQTADPLIIRLVHDTYRAIAYCRLCPAYQTPYLVGLRLSTGVPGYFPGRQAGRGAELVVPARHSFPAIRPHELPQLGKAPSLCPSRQDI